MSAHNVAPPPGAGAGARTSQGRQGAARSPSGSISVVTTEQGLPVALKIDPRELKKSPQHLANEILALCQLSGMRAQVAHRREMQAQGVDSPTIEIMGLATESDVVNAEERIFGDGDLPDSWMRSV
ncbi:Uncharacterised protein [Mycobacteroides abscessus subsp. bolletii]|uniref:hypothetical protein n=1 Tax=Mycobacteroides abscessus TaxID=36809 RepID=UPI00092C2624|nr:hypothetical protein [Mycobacteroides abscessus]SHP73646.1 Uncharacterised protein [Mycobacteroides abscessus subsp. bolletii]SHR30928.1 Uncharacterised protein [Mycobacteroides abscessus subsp. abscessus]SHS01831.1 Uncharacterised protein [Mycobacteroides abscessus subsp. bolletii]SHS34965.1 Uncharacterised protein [Mycobacteroides abscessus subsp. bolletii]SHX91163.1 Uncharacterised protein [Mycobacteroides abscessus subsp. bolletii]